MKPVTDPAILAQLEGGTGLTPVTDPAILAQLDAQEPPQPQRTLGEQAVRGVGRTVRAGVQGLGNLGLSLYDAGAGAIESVTGLPQTKYGPRLKDALTALGLPEAENPTERIAEDVAGGMAGAGGFVKAGTEMVKRAATPIVQKIGDILRTAPGLQVTAGGTGPGAGGVVREEGGGQGPQLAAALAASLAPSAVHQTAARGTRLAVRGGEAGRQRVAGNIKSFEDAGAGTPTVGQATESRSNRAVESVLSKTPGAAGRVLEKAEAEALGLGSKVDEIATSLSGRTGGEVAGRRIRSGLETFVDDFKVKSGELYDKLDRHIPKASQVEVGNTRDALAKLNADIPGAPNLSKWFKNSKIQGIEGALKADTSGLAAAEQNMNPFQLGMLKTLPLTEIERKAMFAAFDEGKLPYEALKKLRTLVGNEISDSTIASDVPRSKWKPLYAALSKDMATAAKEAGPHAEAAFVRANNFHRAGMTRLDDVLGPILKKSDPEDLFLAATSGTKEGATTIAGVMKSLPEESRKVVAATMLRRLGKAVAHQQDDVGGVFSTNTFLKNWNLITPDSKRVLFSTLSNEHRADLDKIAKVASNINVGSKVFANPSGTAQVVAATGGVTAFVVSLLTGQAGVAAAIAGGAGLANMQARLMTNPKFVRWLAKSTSAPAEQLPAQLNALFQQSLYMKGEERKDVREFVRTAREAATSQRQGLVQ